MEEEGWGAVIVLSKTEATTMIAEMDGGETDYFSLFFSLFSLIAAFDTF